MAVPTSISDLDAVAANNSPAGSEPIGTNLDNYIRAHAAIIKQVSNASVPAGLATASGLTAQTGTLIGRSTAGTGAVEEITCTAAGRAILDDADADAQCTTLGLVIGTNVQEYDAQLFSNIPQNSKSAAYTLVATDAQKHILHPSADTTARVFTIPANSSVAYPIGTAITFVNQNGAGVVTIAITTDTMRLAGAGTTGSRTLAANGVATALKVTATEWIISGSGLS